MLESEARRLRRAADLAGLIRVQANALAVAEESTGRIRKRAQRAAMKANAGIDHLRRSGIETEEERKAREAREAREASWKAQQDGAKMLERFVAFLQLQWNDGREPPESLAVFQSFVRAQSDGRLQVDIAEPFKLWSLRIIAFYDRSRGIFADVGTQTLRNEQRTIERILKSVAVALMTSGAEVRGLTTDAVPLVAYSLFNGKLPVPPDADTPLTAERVNNLLLSAADEVAAMPVDARHLFLGLLELAVLIGEAQVYAEHLSLTSLSLS